MKNQRVLPNIYISYPERIKTTNANIDQKRLSNTLAFKDKSFHNHYVSGLTSIDPVKEKVIKLLLKNRECDQSYLVNLNKMQLNRYENAQDKNTLQKLSKSLRHKTIDCMIRKSEKSMQFQRLENSNMQNILYKYQEDKQSQLEAAEETFIKNLRAENHFFNKIDDILLVTLLKIGSVKVFISKQKIFDQCQEMKHIGLVLWGELNIKKKRTKLKISCFPGQCFNEQLILESSQSDFKKQINFQKGKFFTQEYCKAFSNSGVLFVQISEYKLAENKLFQNGFKKVIHLFEQILRRSYLKKIHARKIFG